MAVAVNIYNEKGKSQLICTEMSRFRQEINKKTLLNTPKLRFSAEKSGSGFSYSLTLLDYKGSL